jgi:hypothetical protein
MLRLSNEILLFIFEYLYYIYSDKDNLLVIRVISKRFVNIRQDLAFKYIIFLQDKKYYSRFL